MTKKEMYLEPEVKVVNLRLSGHLLTVSNNSYAPDYEKKTIDDWGWED